MSADSRSDLYRVVAIRSDGTRVVLASNLRLDRARAIVDALSDVAAFSKIDIEREPADPSGRSP